MARAAGRARDKRETSSDCPMRPHCEAHNVPCGGREGGGCTLTRRLDAEGWPVIPAPRKQAAAGDSPGAPACGSRLVGPRFNKETRQLLVDGEVIRTFRRLAPDQMAILIAFEDRGWPPWIEDPFGRPGPLDAKHRLSDALAALNENQKRELIRFKVERGTRRVWWTRVRD